MELLRQTISDHPMFGNIKREVVVYGANIDGKFNQIVIDAEVRYYDENQDGKDVSAGFNGKLKDWIINNADFTTMRDHQGNILSNPDYQEPPTDGEDTREEHEKEKYLKAPSFDYFFAIIKNPKSPSLINILQMHIVENDKIKFFDKMLNIH